MSAKSPQTCRRDRLTVGCCAPTACPPPVGRHRPLPLATLRQPLRPTADHHAPAMTGRCPRCRRPPSACCCAPAAHPSPGGRYNPLPLTALRQRSRPMASSPSAGRYWSLLPAAAGRPPACRCATHARRPLPSSAAGRSPPAAAPLSPTRHPLAATGRCRRAPPCRPLRPDRPVASSSAHVPALPPASQTAIDVGTLLAPPPSLPQHRHVVVRVRGGERQQDAPAPPAHELVDAGAILVARRPLGARGTGPKHTTDDSTRREAKPVRCACCMCWGRPT